MIEKPLYLEPRMCTSVTVLLEMFSPDFREGYYRGRMRRFEGEAALNDLELLEEFFMLARDYASGLEEKADAAYQLGQLIGKLSCNVIPRQPSEPDPHAHEQHYLSEVRQLLESSGCPETTLALIEATWDAQNELARLLPLDLYQRFLLRGSSLPGE